MRLLAEAVWYPTALLPSQGVKWEPVDDTSAKATLHDRNATVTLLIRVDARGLIASALAACSSAPPTPPPGPVATTILVVKRGWHTDVCVRSEDASPWVKALARGFDGARFLCFGFGERQYVVTRDHGPLATLSALFPSQAALLMTVLRDSPGVAFGPSRVVSLGVSRTGLTGLQAFLLRHDGGRFVGRRRIAAAKRKTADERRVTRI